MVCVDCHSQFEHGKEETSSWVSGQELGSHLCSSTFFLYNLDRILWFTLYLSLNLECSSEWKSSRGFLFLYYLGRWYISWGILYYSVCGIGYRASVFLLRVISADLGIVFVTDTFFPVKFDVFSFEDMTKVTCVVYTDWHFAWRFVDCVLVSLGFCHFILCSWHVLSRHWGWVWFLSFLLVLHVLTSETVLIPKDV